jgi:hypothetical protein
MYQFDAQQALGFVVNQSHVVNRTVYEIRYPQYDFARLAFVDSSSPEWAGGIDTYISDMTGKADWYSGYAKDIPLADVNMDKIEKSFQMAAIGYQWNVEEIGKAQFLGMNLPDRRARSARQAYNQFMYELVTRGKTEKRLGGLVNYTGITFGTFPADGTGASTYWSTKTPAQIVRDINSLLTGIWTDTLQIEMADTLLLSPTDAMYLAQTPYSSTTMETIWSFVQKTNVYTLETGQPLTMRTVRGLENDGAGGISRVVAYRNAPDVVKVHLPMPHRFLSPYQDGPLNFQIPGIFRTGGVEILQPGAFRYGDGASA